MQDEARRKRRISSILVVVFFLFLHTWWATAGKWSFASDPNDLKLLNAQVEAFAHGQLSLLERPNPILLEQPNPYSPEQNRATRLLDAVLFDKKYYTYFGPAPLVLFMLPWQAIFDRPISPAFLAWILSFGAGLAQALAVREVVKRWFSSTSALLSLSLEIGYSVSGLLFCLAISHETFDIPVLSGVFFTSWQIYFLTKTFSRSDGEKKGQQLLGSLCAGLAVASRASLIPSASLMLLSSILYASTADAQKSTEIGTSIFGAAIFRGAILRTAIPFGACLLALAAYNTARFGNPLNFGNKYTLVELDWTTNAAFSARYIPLNAYYNFISVPKLTYHFPFFVDSAAPPLTPPDGYLSSYIDRMMGCLPGYIFFAFAGIMLVLVFRRIEYAGLRWLSATLLGAGLLLSLVLCAFVGASVRYQAELLTPFYLPAVIAALWLAGRPNRTLAIFTEVAAVLALLWTFAANVSIATVGYRGLAAKNPTMTSAIGAVVDRAVYPIERMFGLTPKMPLLAVRFPTDQTGRLEPLWVGGRPGEADFLYVNYVSDRLIQFGFESMGRGGPVSPAVPIDYHVPHQLRLLLGSYAPAANHPLFHGIKFDETNTPAMMLGIELDGKIVMATSVNFHDAKGIYFLGSSPDEAAFGRRFTGDLEVQWKRLSQDDYHAWLEAKSTLAGLH